jgi:2-C-methyl-D-erythritol 4-phosphate cytidylyltransferase
VLSWRPVAAAGWGAADKLWHELLGRHLAEPGCAARRPGMSVVAVVVPADGMDRSPRLSPHQLLTDAGWRRWSIRADSVLAGLKALTDAGVTDGTVVLVHDAARPAATVALMTQVAAAATDGAGAVPVVAVHDTLKRVRDGLAVETVDRSDLGAAQTPQAASLGILRAALEAARAQGQAPTDEAAALSLISVPVRAVPGDPASRKVTDPDDLP